MWDKWFIGGRWLHLGKSVYLRLFSRLHNLSCFELVSNLFIKYLFSSSTEATFLPLFGRLSLIKKSKLKNHAYGRKYL